MLHRVCAAHQVTQFGKEGKISQIREAKCNSEGECVNGMSERSEKTEEIGYTED